MDDKQDSIKRVHFPKQQTGPFAFDPLSSPAKALAVGFANILESMPGAEQVLTNSRYVQSLLMKLVAESEKFIREKTGDHDIMN